MKIITLSTAGTDRPRVRKVTWNGREIPAFLHGETGRGRAQVRILCERDPTVQDEWALVILHRELLLLRPKAEPDGEALILWSLSPGFRGGARFDIRGSAKMVAWGMEAQGDAGAMGGALCPVIHMTGPCWLTWSRTGRLYGGHPNWVAYFSGQTWVVTTQEDYEALVKLGEVPPIPEK